VLEHVVVGAGVQGLHHALVVVPSGGHDHRDRGHRAEHAQELAAVQVGESQIEDDEVGALLDGLLQAGQGRRCRRDHVTALAQRPDQGGADAFVVFHDEDLGHAGTLTR